MLPTREFGGVEGGPALSLQVSYLPLVTLSTTHLAPPPDTELMSRGRRLTQAAAPSSPAAQSAPDTAGSHSTRVGGNRSSCTNQKSVSHNLDQSQLSESQSQSIRAQC